MEINFPSALYMKIPCSIIGSFGGVYSYDYALVLKPLNQKSANSSNSGVAANSSEVNF